MHDVNEKWAIRLKAGIESETQANNYEKPATLKVEGSRCFAGCFSVPCLDDSHSQRWPDLPCREASVATFQLFVAGSNSYLSLSSSLLDTHHVQYEVRLIKATSSDSEPRAQGCEVQHLPRGQHIVALEVLDLQWMPGVNGHSPRRRDVEKKRSVWFSHGADGIKCDRSLPTSFGPEVSTQRRPTSWLDSRAAQPLRISTCPWLPKDHRVLALTH